MPIADYYQRLATISGGSQQATDWVKQRGEELRAQKEAQYKAEQEARAKQLKEEQEARQAQHEKEQEDWQNSLELTRQQQAKTLQQTMSNLTLAQQQQQQALIQQQNETTKRIQAQSGSLQAQPVTQRTWGVTPGNQYSDPREYAAQTQHYAAMGKGGAIVNAARAEIGKPYVWGGSSEKTSFDCSGLVQYAYKKVGINLPRVSNQQAMSGVRAPISALKPGDLVAWDNSTRNKGADHVAIYVGNGQIIEAARTGTNIRQRALGSNEGAWGIKVL